MSGMSREFIWRSFANNNLLTELSDCGGEKLD